MNDIPKNNVGKVLRNNFSSRLNLPCFTSASEVSAYGLLYEASCTTTDTAVNFILSSRAVEWSVNDVIETVKKHPQIKACAAYRNGGKFFLFIANVGDDDGVVLKIEKYLQSNVHDYMLPTDIMIVGEHTFKDWESIDEKQLAHLVKQQQKTTDDPVVLLLCDLFGLAIGTPKDSVDNLIKFPADGNFFDHGGNSLKSGFLMSIIRKKLGVQLPVTKLYEEGYQTPAGLAIKCLELMSKDHRLLTQGYDKFRIDEDGTDLHKTFNSSNYKERSELRPLSGAKNPFNPFIMLFQASPFYLMQPIAHIFRWTIFVNVVLFLASTRRANLYIPNILWLLIAILITGISLNVVFPLVGILMKWLVIGRYRSGTYPLWSSYYLRWWFINKFLLVTGLGIFKLNSKLNVLYLRMMGAKIGRNSRVSYQANIQEYDLINIGSDCYIDDCTVRPFVLSTGHMNLAKIVIGDNCVIGFRSNIVAGTSLSNGTIVGPQTTTYTREMQGNGSSAHKDTAEGVELGYLCRETFPEPHLILEYLIGWPIIILTQIISHIPWFYCLYLLTKGAKERHVRNSASVAEMILYFTSPNRIGYFILAKIVRRYVVQLLYIILVILIKRMIIGEFKAGPRKLDQLSLMRYWLMKNLLSLEKWKLVTAIVGSHYEGISIIYRLLGAKVGKRVYWPGSSINLVEFDLLTVGNDVIFGSRSQILCGDANECAPVNIADGAMCADNCVILPGGHIGRNAILGTGGLLKKHFHLADRSVWYGSFNGNAIKLRDGTISRKPAPAVDIKDNDKTIGASNTTIISIENYDEEDTIKPFGCAFYERKASYFVFPLCFILFYNAILLFIGTALWSIPLLAALQITALFIPTDEVVVTGTMLYCQSEGQLILILFCSFSILYVSIIVLISSVEIISKWTLIGRHKEGTYNWDVSSYIQRWQVLIEIQKMGRSNTLNFMGGSSWIILFFRALGCKIGKRVCLYPNGGDPVITEPDLVVLQDDVAVDKASLVCHLNTSGQFSINPLLVGAGSVLQNDSRLASGATMLEDCTLLDRSCIIQGEIAEAHSVWQGYPAISTSLEEQYSLYAAKKSV